MANPDRETLDRLADDVAAGRLRVPITTTVGLAEVPQQIAAFAQGALGKQAVRVG